MRENGWVFISHSHKDVDSVRKIRNYLESLGLEPLLFYLKCLSDEDEIDDLIKREINAREWFIYMDSPNARASKWVKKEREIIESHPDKKVFNIDLNQDYESQKAIIDHIARQIKVYISCVCKDKRIFQSIREKLLNYDMQVWSDEELPSGEDWRKCIHWMINNTTHNGFVLVLLSEHSANSQFVKAEIELTKRQQGKIIPIYIGHPVVSKEIAEMIGDLQGYPISEDPTEDELELLVGNILKNVVTI